MARWIPAITPTLAAVATLACAAVAVAAVAVAEDTPSPPADVPRLVGQRAIEVPGSRIISMSPDGRWLAAVRPAIGYQRGSLCAIDIETLADRACGDLSRLGAGLRVEDVTWSPDGEHLAFAELSFQTFKDGDLWLMDTVTGALTDLDDDGFEGTIPLMSGDWPAMPITVPVSPAFSPDGATVAFSRTVLTKDGDRRNVIATVPVDGGPVEEIATVSTDEMGVAYFGIGWAPDGSTLYVSVQRTHQDDLRNGVWVMDADGTDARLLVGRYQDGYGPAVLDVASDGATLLLQDPAAMGQLDLRQPVYATADTGSGTPSPLLPLEADPPRGSFVSWAGYSPDGRWLLTLDRLAAGRPVVRVREVGGTVDWPLLEEPLEQAGPIDRGIPLTWSANGTALLTGAGAFETATLLTIDGGVSP